ncbi:MAG: hypothetical protein KDJ73_11945 [Notoacmeibacter sp.]|nr:hypothetical protein [Notoacmeibacter sp.]MCC0032113.1 hypothetical protein [Brucellaceae bacterium]
MTKLGGLLKRKQKKIEVPESFGQDRSELYRRMDRVLARPTRHEMAPPSLSPEDYLMAGFLEAPPSAYAAQEQETGDDAAEGHDSHFSEDANDDDVAPDLAADEADVAALDDGEPLSANEAGADATEMEEPEAAAAGRASADDGLDNLRAMLNSSLASLRSEDAGETAQAETSGFADGALPASDDPVANAWDDEPANTGRTDAPAEAEFVEAACDEEVAVAPGEAELAGDTFAADEHTAEPEAGGIEAEWQDDPDEAEPAACDAGAEVEASMADSQVADKDIPLEEAGAPDVPELQAMDGRDTVEPLTVLLLTPASTTPGGEHEAAVLTAQIMDYLMFDAGYYPEELPANGIRAWCMDFYVKNVREGGMGAFVYNAHGQPEIWEACAEGMSACGAEAHLDLFNALRDLLTRDAALAVALGDDASAGADHEGLVALEEEFAAVEGGEPLAELAGRWLVTLPEVEMVEEDDLQPIVTSLGEAEALSLRRAA